MPDDTSRLPQGTLHPLVPETSLEPPHRAAPPDAGTPVVAMYHLAPGMFEAYGAKVVAGRALRAGDLGGRQLALGLLAALGPARRRLRIEPTEALRAGG
jgi:hypothetical protein